MKEYFTSHPVYLIAFTTAMLLSCNGSEKTETAQVEVLESGIIQSDLITERSYEYAEVYNTRPDTENQIAEQIHAIFQDSRYNLWFGTNTNGVCRYNPAADSKSERSLTYFSVDEGLGGIKVTEIIEDKYGNIWFATSGGVSRYNGRSFTNFTKKDGLGGTETRSILEDKNSIIWVGTSNGLYKYDGKAFKPFPIPEFPTQGVWSIEEDSKGNLWFGIDENGVVKYDGKSFSYLNTEDGLCDNNILTIIEDKEGTMWFGSRLGGVSRYRGEFFYNFTADDAIKSNEVRTIHEDMDGYVWFNSTGYGIYRFGNYMLMNFGKDDGLPLQTVQSIYQDRQGLLWVGGENGLYCFDGESFINVTKNGPWRIPSKQMKDGC